MVDEYTPTTEELRTLYVEMTEGHREDDPDDAERAAEFDRWLAAHDDELIADAQRKHQTNRVLRRDMEQVEAERDAALAVIEKARGWLSSSQDLRDRIGSALYVLATVNTSALAEHDAEVTAKALKEAARAVERNAGVLLPSGIRAGVSRWTEPKARGYTGAVDEALEVLDELRALAEKGADRA